MESNNSVHFTSIKSEKEGARLLNRLVDVAQPSAVFGEPIKVGDYTLITTSMVSTSLAYGFGGGFEPSTQQNSEGPVSETGTPSAIDTQKTNDSSMVGGGGGGGGYSMSRPVAVITVGPNGVRVEPVIDVTRIGLAVFSTITSILVAAAQIRKKRQRLG